MDYKEILKNKAVKLEELLEKHGTSLPIEEINDIMFLINNTYGIENGKFDALNQEARNKAIMEYHSRLDNAFSKLSQFEEENEKTETREDD